MKNAEEWLNNEMDSTVMTPFKEQVIKWLEQYATLREKEAFKAGFIAGGSGWRYGQHAEKEWETHFDKWHTKHKETDNRIQWGTFPDQN